MFQGLKRVTPKVQQEYWSLEVNQGLLQLLVLLLQGVRDELESIDKAQFHEGCSIPHWNSLAEEDSSQIFTWHYSG